MERSPSAEAGSFCHFGIVHDAGGCQKEGLAPLWFTPTLNDRLLFVLRNDVAQKCWANWCRPTTGARAMNRWQTSRRFVECDESVAIGIAQVYAPARSHKH